MSIPQNVKIDSPFEALFNVANTSSGKEFFEEGVPLSKHIIPSFLLPDTLPALDFGETDPTGRIKRVRMPLSLDNSVPGQETYFAVSTWQSGWSSGSYNLADLMRRWLGPSDKPFFTVKSFGGTAGDTEIPPLDPSGPLFTARAGSMRYVNGGRPSEAGTTQNNTIWLEGYHWEGETVDDLLEMIGQTGDGRLIIRGSLIGVKDGNNRNFQLPAQVDGSVYFEIRCSGVPLSSNDFTVAPDGINVELIAAPVGVQSLDVVYYPPQA